MAKVITHRKLPTGRYLLEVDEGGDKWSWTWPAAPDGVKNADWEAQQLEEAKALIAEDKARRGRKLKSEGQTL